MTQLTDEEMKQLYADNLVLHNKSMKESMLAMKLGVFSTLLHIGTLILNIYMLAKMIDLINVLHP